MFFVAAELPTFDLCSPSDATAVQTLVNLVEVGCHRNISDVYGPLIEALRTLDSSDVDRVTVDCW